MHRKIHITTNGFTTREIPMNWFLGFICSTSAWVTQVKVTCHFNHAKCPFYQSQIANFRTWFQHKDQSSCKVEHDIKVANFYEENTARHTQGRKRRLRSTASRTRGGRVASFFSCIHSKVFPLSVQNLNFHKWGVCWYSVTQTFLGLRGG